LNPAGNGISIQPHKGVPRRVGVRGNFIAVKGFGLRVLEAHPAYTPVVEHNEIFVDTTLAMLSADNTSDSAKQVKRAMAGWLERVRVTQGSGARPNVFRALGLACVQQTFQGTGIPPVRVIHPATTACEAWERMR
jgi:hypothetical protein